MRQAVTEMQDELWQRSRATHASYPASDEESADAEGPRDRRDGPMRLSSARDGQLTGQYEHAELSATTAVQHAGAS